MSDLTTSTRIDKLLTLTSLAAQEKAGLRAALHLANTRPPDGSYQIGPFYVTSLNGEAAYTGHVDGGGVSGDLAFPPTWLRIGNIGSGVFYGCVGLTSIVFPDSLVSIGVNAFSNCSALTSITLPDSLTSIGSNAFYGCVGLTSIVFPDSLVSIGVNAFASCYALASVNLPDSLTSLGSGAFYGCVGLTSIVFPDSLVTINSSAFSSSGLNSINLPDSLTDIGSWSFYSCVGLTSVTFPASLTSIGSRAFYRCIGLTSIFAEGNAPSSVGSNAFYYVPATLYYKAGTTGWTDPWNGIPTAVWNNWPNPIPN
jgi:hypothetical protein